MKVCTVSHKACWHSPAGEWFSTGGFPAQIDAIGSLFDEHQIVICGTKPKPNGAILPKCAAVTALRVPGRRFLARTACFTLLSPLLFRRIKSLMADSDVVHLPVPGDVGLLGLVAARQSRKKVLCRYEAAWDNRNWTSYLARRMLLDSPQDGSWITILCGEEGKPPRHDFRYLFPPSYGDDLVHATPIDLARPVNHPFQVAWVGRLTGEKAPMAALQAWSWAFSAKDNGSVCLQVVGDGPWMARMRGFVADRHLNHQVVFHGMVPPVRVLELLRTADLLLMTSLTEGYGKVRLEAMLCGVPVLTTDVGCARVILGREGERGWVVPIRDPSAVAKALQSVVGLGAGAWPALRSRCRKFAESRTSESYVRRLEDIMQEQWGFVHKTRQDSAFLRRLS